MFNRKQKEIDELNARCKDLAGILRDCDLKVEQRDILIKDLKDNDDVQKQAISVLTERLKRINKLATGNQYNNGNTIISKIIELSEINCKYDR